MARRRLKKRVKIIFRLLTLVIVLAGAYFFVAKTDTGQTFLTKIKELEIFNKEETKKEKDNKENEPDETWPKTSTISLVATGDVLLHNGVYVDGYNRATDTFDFTPHVAMVKDIVSQYDIAYFNQETLYGGKQVKQFPNSGEYHIAGYSSYPFFNSPSEYGDAMFDAGFNMVSLASNHSADCTTITKECINNALDYFESKEDIVYAGFNRSADNTNNYIIEEKEDISYTLLNYTTSLNGLDGYVSGQEYLINTWDEEKVKQDIAEVRDKVDVLIVAMHWHTGAEYSFTVTQENKNIAQFLADQGVDIILGTYSHCLQPFDIINDHTVVFYSLGNFVSNQGALVSSIGYKGIVGALASVDITKTEYEDGSVDIQIHNVGADLTYNYSEGASNYLVVPFSKMNETYNANYLEIFTEYSAVLKGLNDNITIAQPKILKEMQ